MLLGDPVTFRFRKIGPVKDAALELGDLTIIAGRNNTGKTCLTYALYGFLKLWADFPKWFSLTQEKRSDVEFPDWCRLGRQLAETGRGAFPLDDSAFDRQRKRVFQLLARGFSERALAHVFRSRPETFSGSLVEIVCRRRKPKAPRSYKADVPDGGSLSIEYDGTEAVVSVEEETRNLPPDELTVQVGVHYVLFLVGNLFPDPFILSAERIGISRFCPEVDFAVGQIDDLLQKMGGESGRKQLSVYGVIQRSLSPHALPIRDNIDLTRSIPDRRTAKSEFFRHGLFNDVKEMTAGHYSATANAVHFVSKARGKGRHFNIPLHAASSSVRGLSDLYFFLKHAAERNHLLVIEEPESHLDTTNQIRSARLLARCVGVGLRVLVTTHSDYVIKEVNNLIMLSRPFADKDAVVRRLKYGPKDALDPESIRAYVAENNTLTRCTVDPYGIEMPMFDRTIDRINNVANELASRVGQEV